VGKTTTSINLAASLVKKDKRILLIDMDPQGNASVGCGVDTDEVENTIYDLLLGDTTAKEAVVKTACGVDVLMANGDLAGAQVELLNEIGRELKLQKALALVQNDYDYIFIDCPPRTMFDGRNSLSNEVSRQLQTHFGDKVYQTVVPRNVRLAEAPSYGEPAITYAPQSKGAKAYLQLADEILQIAASKAA